MCIPVSVKEEISFTRSREVIDPLYPFSAMPDIFFFSFLLTVDFPSRTRASAINRCLIYVYIYILTYSKVDRLHFILYTRSLLQ